ncbi:unnamed protein product, partial [Protopolystoma xenopodis]
MEFSADTWSFCVETKLFRNSSALDMYLRTTAGFDRIGKTMTNFVGMHYNESRIMKMSFDVQISVGAAHAGYPIMAHLYWQEDLVNINKTMTTNIWGYCHEFGHNLQRPWHMLEQCLEVTNNIMCLVAYNYVLNMSQFELGKGIVMSRLDAIVNWWNSNGTYPDWSNMGEMYYAYIGTTMGIAAVGNTWRAYELHPEIRERRGFDIT